MKKKVLSVFLCAGLAVSMLAGCGSGNSDTKDKKDAAADSDLEYVKDKGTLVVGITDFEPMDYKDDNGNWIGFDADMASAFAEELDGAGFQKYRCGMEWNDTDRRSDKFHGMYGCLSEQCTGGGCSGRKS